MCRYGGRRWNNDQRSSTGVWEEGESRLCNDNAVHGCGREKDEEKFEREIVSE